MTISFHLPVKYFCIMKLLLSPLFSSLDSWTFSFQVLKCGPRWNISGFNFLSGISPKFNGFLKKPFELWCCGVLVIDKWLLRLACWLNIHVEGVPKIFWGAEGGGTLGMDDRCRLCTVMNNCNKNKEIYYWLVFLFTEKGNGAKPSQKMWSKT